MKLSTLLLLTLAAAGQASARGTTQPVTTAGEVVVASQGGAFDWTGFYAGLRGINGDLESAGNEADTSGYGLQVGYLHDLGAIVVGGELDYSEKDTQLSGVSGGSTITSKRLKLIGGYDAGRFLPYAFVGMSEVEVSGEGTISDTYANYGIGGRYAFGAEGQLVIGLEYLVEQTDIFEGTTVNFDSSDLALRLDYRF